MPLPDGGGFRSDLKMISTPSPPPPPPPFLSYMCLCFEDYYGLGIQPDSIADKFHCRLTSPMGQACFPARTLRSEVLIECGVIYIFFLFPNLSCVRLSRIGHGTIETHRGLSACASRQNQCIPTFTFTQLWFIKLLLIFYGSSSRVTCELSALCDNTPYHRAVSIYRRRVTQFCNKSHNCVSKQLSIIL